MKTLMIVLLVICGAGCALQPTESETSQGAIVSWHGVLDRADLPGLAPVADFAPGLSPAATECADAGAAAGLLDADPDEGMMIWCCDCGTCCWSGAGSTCCSGIGPNGTWGCY